MFSGFKFWGDSESEIRIIKFHPCGLLNPYFWQPKWAKLDSAIGNVPTDKNVSTAGIHWSFMYESHSKRDFDIFWSGCCDIAKSSTFYHFICYKCIPLAILRHRHETHSIVCTKCESKGIMEKFTVLMKGHTKWSLRVLWNVKLVDYESLNANLRLVLLTRGSKWKPKA